MATATAENVVQAVSRRAQGKNEARRVRKGGRVPAVIYGAGKEAASISLDPKQIALILHSEAGHNTIFDVELDGERTKAMIVDWQYDPIRGALLHCDLKRIAMDQRLRVKVPIMLQGEAAGVKQQGGILEQVTREVELECLPADIPSHIDVDVAHLVFGVVMRVSDLPHGGKLRFLTDENLPVAHVIAVKEVVAATAEAGAAPEAAAAPAEPEVIKKGKQEAEEEAAAAEETGGEKKKKEKE
jgi:large subunit ribosomal protein L25